jgi:hypothetical protein
MNNITYHYRPYRAGGAAACGCVCADPTPHRFALDDQPVTCATCLRLMPPAPPATAALVTEDELAEVERRHLRAREVWLEKGCDDCAYVSTADGAERLFGPVRQCFTRDVARLVHAGEIAPRLAAEVRRLTVAAKEHVCASTIDRDLHREYGETAARLISTEQERDAARAEVAERDAQIARLAVDSAAVEAKLTIEAMAANQRADAAEKLAADLRAKAWALLCARTLVADEGGIITGCSTAALLAYNGAAVDLAAAVGKDDKR